MSQVSCATTMPTQNLCGNNCGRPTKYVYDGRPLKFCSTKCSRDSRKKAIANGMTVPPSKRAIRKANVIANNTPRCVKCENIPWTDTKTGEYGLYCPYHHYKYREIFTNVLISLLYKFYYFVFNNVVSTRKSNQVD